MESNKLETGLTENVLATDLKYNFPDSNMALQPETFIFSSVAVKENSAECSFERRKKKRKKKNKTIPSEIQIMNHDVGDLKHNPLGFSVAVHHVAEKFNGVSDFTEVFPEFDAEIKKKKKKKKRRKKENKKKKANECDPRLTASLHLTDLKSNFQASTMPVHLLSEDLNTIYGLKENISYRDKDIQGEVQCMDKAESCPEFTGNVPGTELGGDLRVALPENMNIIAHSLNSHLENSAKRKKFRNHIRKKTTIILDEVEVLNEKSADAVNLLVRDTEKNFPQMNLTSDNNPERNMPKKKRKRSKRNQNTDAIPDGSPIVDGVKMNLGSSKNQAFETVTGNGLFDSALDNDEGQAVRSISRPNHISELNEELVENIVEGGKTSGHGRALTQGSNAGVIELVHYGSMNGDICSYPKIALPILVRRKLLVLDVNGLLADIVRPAPKNCRGDVHIYGRAVFRRRFCWDFLNFCFQNFYVGIWSSRSKKVLGVVNYLLADLKYKLVFCWDMEQCTKTGFKALENKHKLLVCKELRKIWESDGSKFPWKKGDYDESNTLLLDDSPYKALINPLHTAIFPQPYSYLDKKDNSLGPEGDIRVYLEGLLQSDNVQKYVEQHPFGQRAIGEQDESFKFYSEVLQRISTLSER